MGRIDLPDKYRDEDYSEEVSMDANYWAPIEKIGGEMTQTESEAIESIMYNIRKKPVANRSGRTIGTGVPRVAGKGSNADLSKCGRL